MHSGFWNSLITHLFGHPNAFIQNCLFFSNFEYPSCYGFMNGIWFAYILLAKKTYLSSKMHSLLHNLGYFTSLLHTACFLLFFSGFLISRVSNIFGSSEISKTHWFIYGGWVSLKNLVDGILLIMTFGFYILTRFFCIWCLGSVSPISVQPVAKRGEKRWRIHRLSKLLSFVSLRICFGCCATDSYFYLQNTSHIYSRKSYLTLFYTFSS